MAISDEVKSLSDNIALLQHRLDDLIAEDGLVYGFIKEFQAADMDADTTFLAKIVEAWESFKALHVGDDSYKEELDVLLTPKDATTPPNPVITPTP